MALSFFSAQILQIKNEQGRHKPLSLLCKDISTMNTYAKGIDKARKRSTVVTDAAV